MDINQIIDINDIPDEVLLEIMSHLELQDLGQLSKVSNRFLNLAQILIGQKCSLVRWRLDLFYPPNENPEGVLILDYNRKKRKLVSNHIHRKYRKLSLISKGITKQILYSYPTVKILPVIWRDNNLGFNFLTDKSKEDNDKIGIVDMIW